MTLQEQIEALAFLKPGWNDDEKFPALAINGATIKFALDISGLLQNLDGGWKAGPLPDGSIRLVRGLRSLTVGAL